MYILLVTRNGWHFFFDNSIPFIPITGGAIYSALGLGDNLVHMRHHSTKKAMVPLMDIILLFSQATMPTPRNNAILHYFRLPAIRTYLRPMSSSVKKVKTPGCSLMGIQLSACSSSFDADMLDPSRLDFKCPLHTDDRHHVLDNVCHAAANLHCHFDFWRRCAILASYAETLDFQRR